jgi:hypothetical protein
VIDRDEGSRSSNHWSAPLWHPGEQDVRYSGSVLRMPVSQLLYCRAWRAEIQLLAGTRRAGGSAGKTAPLEYSGLLL